MCEFSSKLVAWMDHELERDEAAAVERHLAACAECRSCVAEFERASREFNAYCEAVEQSKRNGKAVRREAVLWVAAAAIVLAVVFAYPRRQAVPSPHQANTTAAMSKPSLDSAQNSSVRPGPDELRAGTSAMSPARTNTQRVHANRVLANRGRICCAMRKVNNAPADSAAATPFVAARNANWFANEPSVQIAISAAAMFPPGAVPDGINFVADLSIGADGSVQQVRLQPQVSEPERRSSQP